MTIQDDFKAEIETFLERHDMKPAVFGGQALRDPKFVFDLREGRSPSVKTIEKVRAWMAEQDAAPETAPETPPAETPAIRPEPETASSPPPADDPAPKAPSGGGWRKLVVAVLIVFIILFGGVALWKPGALYNLAANLYHRATDNQNGSQGGSGGGNSDLAIEQFSAVVAAVQNDFNSLRQDIKRLDQRLDRLEEAGDQSGSGEAMDSGRIDMLEERIATLENQPAPATSAPSPAISNRLDTLERRVAEAAARPAAPPRELADLRAQVDQMQESLRRLQAQQQALAALSDRVDSLGEELDQVTSGMSDMTGLQAGIEQSAVISAFMRLDADVRSGQPYAASLALYQKQVELQSGSGDWPTAQGLSAQADNGIATTESLQDRLQGLIPKIIAGQEEGGSWSERLWSRLQGIVVVRKTGEQQGDEPDAIVARAETRLAAGDLQGAVDELEALSQGRRAVAADWLADAHTRLDALDALSGMATVLSNAQGS